MDPAGRLIRAVADACHHAGPAATCFEVGEVWIEQEVGRRGVAQTPALQIALAERAGERHAAGENASNLVAMVGRRHGSGSGWSGLMNTSVPSRFIEQGGIGESGGMMDQVDRSRAFAGGVIVTPAGAWPAQVNDAGAF